jgi:hypothetical protein
VTQLRPFAADSTALLTAGSSVDGKNPSARRPFLRMNRLYFVFVTAMSIPVVAESQKTPASIGASVEGDLYLLMKSGDTKKGAGLTVYLLRDTETLHTQWAAACTMSRTALDSLGRQETAIYDSITSGKVRKKRLSELSSRLLPLSRQKDSLYSRAKAAVRVALAQASYRTEGTGINAHFRFTGVPAGKYILFAEWQLGSSDYRWWVPISLSEGQSLHKDLDTSTVGRLLDVLGISRDSLTAATLFCVGKP